MISAVSANAEGVSALAVETSANAEGMVPSAVEVPDGRPSVPASNEGPISSAVEAPEGHDVSSTTNSEQPILLWESHHALQELPLLLRLDLVAASCSGGCGLSICCSSVQVTAVIVESKMVASQRKQ